MSFSDDDEDLPIRKKQRIYYGSLEEKVRENLLSGNVGPNQLGPKYDDTGSNDSDEDEGGSVDEESKKLVSDAIADAVKSGNINISEGKYLIKYLNNLTKS